MANNTGNTEQKSAEQILVETEKDLKATKSELAELKLASEQALFIDLDANQKFVVEYFEFDHKFLNNLAVSAFASVLRGRVSSALNKCIVEKHTAYNKGRAATVAELETEIAMLENMKQSIS